MIGGTDVIIPAIGDDTALDISVQVIRYFWPGARFENAIEDEKYPSYTDIPFVNVEELFVYRDAEAEAAWDADSDDSPLNSMLYLLHSPESVTVVLDDPDAPDVSEILKSIKSRLRTGILKSLRIDNRAEAA